MGKSPADMMFPHQRSGKVVPGKGSTGRYGRGAGGQKGSTITTPIQNQDDADAQAQADQQQAMMPASMPAAPWQDMPDWYQPFDPSGLDDASDGLDVEEDAGPAMLGSVAAEYYASQNPLSEHVGAIIGNEEMQYIKRAYANGRGGTHLGPGKWAGTNDPLVNLELPEWMARRWTVTLAGWNYEGDVGGTNGGPPALTTGFTPEDALDVTIRMQMRVEWGIAGEREFAVIDYPFSGCSFTIQAASIRVYVNTPAIGIRAGGPLPGIGAFASPVERSSVADACQQTTFTYPIQSIAFGSSMAFAVPRRATGYQLIKGQTLTTAQAVALVQCRAGVNPLVFDEGTLLAADYEAGNATLWKELHPFAQYIQVQNNNGAGNLLLGVRFMLDMG